MNLATLPLRRIACGLLLLAAASRCGAEPRPVLICTGAQASPALRQAVSDFLGRAATVPLLRALRQAGEAGEVSAQESEGLLAPAAYLNAAHSHLVVVGLASQDPLMAKTDGGLAGIDEGARRLDALEWGSLQGDVGWVESARNPFLHSHRIKSAPEDTVLVRITGTTEAGVLAALHAFSAGLLNGVVAAGPVARPRTTLLDRDPEAEVPPPLPETVTGEDGTVFAFAGWNEAGEDEYRALLEAGGALPRRVWRAKYLAAGILEQEPIVRWFGGVSRRAYGNAVEVVAFDSEDQAAAARQRLAGKTASRAVPGFGEAAELPWSAQPSESIRRSYGATLVFVAGHHLILASLPAAAAARAVAALP